MSRRTCWSKWFWQAVAIRNWIRSNWWWWNFILKDIKIGLDFNFKDFPKYKALYTEKFNIVEKLKTGQKGFYKGREVVLDLPDRNPSLKGKKFRVFTDSGNRDTDGNIIAIKHEWGASGYRVKNNDDVARKGFLARHGCHTKPEAKDPKNKIFWVCNVALFWKQLGLSSDKEW